MTCDHCNGPGETQQCCWLKGMEIEKFKKEVLHKFIFEVLFDLTISVCSVITDILSLVLYIYNGRWLFVFLTAIPVLLPTSVFTNIYLSDESRGYCKMPSDRMKRREFGKTKEAAGAGSKSKTSEEQDKSSNCNSCFTNLTCGNQCTNARSCCGGFIHMIFHKDSDIRRKGASAVKKSMARSMKYFFGTFILRFIGWAWYFKALIHGIKAYRSPKKFMKIESPDLHWSHDLLVRLDFLQAALENAPQCVVQLYALITQADEQKALGLLTLFFSFVDFVRVAMAVLWDVHKGPVIAPTGCYATLGWKITNFCSWTFLYAARSCSLALAFATSKGWSIVILIVGLLSHIILFARLFSRNKYGVATEKVLVSTFISLFFLPELNAIDMELLVQFYYATTLLQNIFYIIPWNGLDYDYCIKKPPIVLINSTSSNSSEILWREEDFEFDFGAYNTFDNDFEKGKFDRTDSCLIDPVLIVLMVPACTILGMVLRLAAAQKMARFQRTVPATQHSMKMEERIAGIYRKKWTKMNIKELSSAFLKMLRKEVAQSEPDGKKKKDIHVISNELRSEFRASQSFIRNSFNVIFMNRDVNGEQRRSSLQMQNEHLPISRQCSFDKNWSFPVRGLPQRSMSLAQNTEPFPVDNYFLTLPSSFTNPFKDDEFLAQNPNEENNDQPVDNPVNEIVPQSFFKPVLQRNLSSSTSSEENTFPTLAVDVQAIQIDFPDGKTHVLEMGWI